MRAVANHGTKWAFIVKLIPGRTDNAIKNRWNSTARKLLRVQRRCGEIPGVGDLDILGTDAAVLAQRMLESNMDWRAHISQPPAKRKLLLPEQAKGAGSQGKRGKLAPVSPPAALDLLCRLAECSEVVECTSPRAYEAAHALLGTGMPLVRSSSS